MRPFVINFESDVRVDALDGGNVLKQTIANNIDASVSQCYVIRRAFLLLMTYQIVRGIPPDRPRSSSSWTIRVRDGSSPMSSLLMVLSAGTPLPKTQSVTSSGNQLRLEYLTNSPDNVGQEGDLHENFVARYEETGNLRKALH